MSSVKPFTLSDNARDRFEAIGWAVTDSGCWEWGGYVEPESSPGVGGYGRFNTGGPRREARQILAHRASYAIYRSNPGDRQVLHACDNPPCVNPDHLSLGEQPDNVADMFAKGRQRYAETYTHELLVEALTAYYTDGLTAPLVESRFGISKHYFALIRAGRYRPEVREEVRAALGPSARRTVHNSRLSMEDAREIRLAYVSGGITQQALAARYGTVQSLIGRIIRNELWKEAS